MKCYIHDSRKPAYVRERQAVPELGSHKAWVYIERYRFTAVDGITLKPRSANKGSSTENEMRKSGISPRLLWIPGLSTVKIVNDVMPDYDVIQESAGYRYGNRYVKRHQCADLSSKEDPMRSSSAPERAWKRDPVLRHRRLQQRLACYHNEMGVAKLVTVITKTTNSRTKFDRIRSRQNIRHCLDNGQSIRRDGVGDVEENFSYDPVFRKR